MVGGGGIGVDGPGDLDGLPAYSLRALVPLLVLDSVGAGDVCICVGLLEVDDRLGRSVTVSDVSITTLTSELLGPHRCGQSQSLINWYSRIRFGMRMRKVSRMAALEAG